MQIEFTEQEGHALMVLMDAGLKHDDKGGMAHATTAVVWSQKLARAQEAESQMEQLRCAERTER